MVLYGQGTETYALGRTLCAPVMASARQYTSFESQLQDISATGDLDAKHEEYDWFNYQISLTED